MSVMIRFEKPSITYMYMSVLQPDTTFYSIVLYSTVALLAGQRSGDSQVVGSSPGWAPLLSGLGQATYTCVPLSPSSIHWYWPKE